VGTKCAWVNVSREFVLGGLAQTLPPSLTLLEILEDQVIDEKLVSAVAELKHDGYHLALDDFTYDESCEPLLRLVDVVKLDLLALGREALSREVERLRPYGLTLLAEKLESREDYDYCMAAGCDLFQGYFFCRPELVRGRRIDANRLSLLEVLAALQEPDVELHTLERIIARDVGLSYRLLRYINSAFFGLRQEVRSIGQALALLGVESLSRWASLSVFASIDDKPQELTVTALIRGRFCELAGAKHLRAASHSELFTLGLFSVIDALMDTSIETVLAKIPFPPDICDALTSHRGEKGKLLACITALEAGAFDRAEELIPDAGELYLEALSWANEAADPLFEQPASAAA
jgi:EAL and modified HD-GYP domain-containing signal transduction protein